MSHIDRILADLILLVIVTLPIWLMLLFGAGIIR